MNMSFGGWSATGIVAAIAIVAGIVLLIAYAVRRGLVDRDLDGTIAAEGAAGSTVEPGVNPAANPAGSSRLLGAAGATFLGIGLVLGLVSAILGWGGSGGTAGCAQSWNGCPQATPGAQASAPPVSSIVP
jgi:hypothetical protein